MGWHAMGEAGRLSEWLGECSPGAPVCVRVRFPDIDWEVDDWAFAVSGSLDEPVIEVTVHGFDFDYPDVARRLKAVADRLANYYSFVS